MPQLVGALGLEADRSSRTDHARVVKARAAHEPVEGWAFEQPLGRPHQPVGRLDPGVLQQLSRKPLGGFGEIARRVESRWPFLLDVRTLSAATISA